MQPLVDAFVHLDPRLRLVVLAVLFASLGIALQLRFAPRRKIVWWKLHVQAINMTFRTRDTHLPATVYMIENLGWASVADVAIRLDHAPTRFELLPPK